jgi:cyanophycinase
MLERAGAKNLRVLHPRKRTDLSDEAFLAPLREARGVWFSGGRQWRFVDVFGGTPAEGLFRDVLRRGGVIGGSSAGASIQAEYMPRGNPLGNFEMMAEGYERGFGFLPGTAIDQHFTQRGRFRDMTSLVNTFPQLLGLGIDESTAAVVEGHVLEVVGKNRIAIYDRQAFPPPVDYPESVGAKPPTPPDFLELKPGDKYDLQTRRKL